MAVESMPEKEAGRRRQQRWLVGLVVAIFGVVDALYVQKDNLSLRTAPGFVGGLLALLAAGEITVRILDRLRNREGHADRGVTAADPVGAVLDSLGGVVLHHICAGHKPIDHLVFRPDGVVFLIETQPEPGLIAAEGEEIQLNGRPLPRHLFKQTRRKLDWLRDFLRAQLGCEARLEAGLVFANADVAAGYQSEGVALLGLEHLQPWLDTAEPNEEFSKRLWPQMERLKSELLALSEPPSQGALAAVPFGVVLLLGIAWLTLSAPAATKPPLTSAPATQPAQPAPKAAALFPASKEPTLAPEWLKEIHLEGLSGAPPHRLAIINRKTVAVGESAIIQVAGRDVLISCVSIQGESVTITIGGTVGTTDLSLKHEP